MIHVVGMPNGVCVFCGEVVFKPDVTDNPILASLEHMAWDHEHSESADHLRQIGGGP